MTHEDAGHYAAKHGPGVNTTPKIAAAIKGKVSNGKITCAAMHGISEDTGEPPSEVGKNADLLEVRLTKCQLGLFGYEPQKKIVEPATDLDPEILNAIQESVTDNRLSCAACWGIAERLNCKKMDVSAVCEKRGIKISPCQLGAF